MDLNKAFKRLRIILDEDEDYPDKMWDAAKHIVKEALKVPLLQSTHPT